MSIADNPETTLPLEVPQYAPCGAVGVQGQRHRRPDDAGFKSRLADAPELPGLHPVVDLGMVAGDPGGEILGGFTATFFQIRNTNLIIAVLVLRRLLLCLRLGFRFDWLPAGAFPGPAASWRSSITPRWAAPVGRKA